DVPSIIRFECVTEMSTPGFEAVEVLGVFRVHVDPGNPRTLEDGQGPILQVLPRGDLETDHPRQKLEADRGMDAARAVEEVLDWRGHLLPSSLEDMIHTRPEAHEADRVAEDGG